MAFVTTYDQNGWGGKKVVVAPNGGGAEIGFENGVPVNNVGSTIANVEQKQAEKQAETKAYRDAAMQTLGQHKEAMKPVNLFRRDTDAEGVGTHNTEGVGTPASRAKASPMIGAVRQFVEQPRTAANPSDVSQGTVTGDENISYADFKNRMFDEEAIRKESNRRAQVMAIGDALRHMGNLYFTGVRGASPQKFGTMPATEERERYEKGAAMRDQYAYNQYMGEQKQKMAQLDNERKNALAQSQMEKDRITAQRTLQDMGIAAEKWPIEKQRLIADYVVAVNKGDEALAKAKEAQVQATLAEKYGDEQARATIDKINAQRRSADAQANSANSTAALNKKKAQYLDDDQYDVLYDNEGNEYKIKKNVKWKDQLKGVVKKLKDASGDPSSSSLVDTINDGTAKDGDLLSWALAHTDDPEVRAMLDTMSGNSWHD